MNKTLPVARSLLPEKDKPAATGNGQRATDNALKGSLPPIDVLLAEFDSGKVPRSETWQTLITGLYFNFDSVSEIEGWYNTVQELTSFNQELSQTINAHHNQIEIWYGQIDIWQQQVANHTQQAAASASAAKGSETASASSASSAVSSANTATQQATAAEASASQAKSSETASASSASQAQGSAASAGSSASDALNSANNAKASETGAQQSATNAQTAEQNAQESASEAEDSKTSAASSASTATQQAGIAKNEADRSEAAATSLKAISNPNLLINGDFSVWQRGTVIDVPTADMYTADRWNSMGWGQGIRVQREDASSAIPVTYLRAESTGASTGVGIRQFLENFKYLSNKQATLSFKVHVTGTCLRVTTSISSVSEEFFTVPHGTNTTIVKTFIFGDLSGLTEVGIGAYLGRDDVTTGDNLRIWDMKLELGSVATPFIPDDPATNLAKCQRYYYRVTAASSADSAAPFCSGFWNSSDSFMGAIFLPVPLRASPTLTYSSLNAIQVEGYDAAISSLQINVSPHTLAFPSHILQVSAIFSRGSARNGELLGVLANNWVAFDAEL